MTTAFADTVFFIALMNSRDSLHERAAAIAEQQDLRVVTTEFVLLEAATFFTQPINLAVYVQLILDLAPIRTRRLSQPHPNCLTGD